MGSINTPKRTAVITGGSSGIGRAVAETWLQSAPSAQAVILDRNVSAMAEFPKSLAERTRCIQVDITSTAEVNAAFADIAATEGSLAALVACAGISRPVATAEMTDDDWMSLIDVHLHGTMRVCRAAYELLRRDEPGSIVTISSIASALGMPKRASYNTAKTAIEGFTRSLAVEWAPDGIRANAVAPGYVTTPFTDDLAAAGKLQTKPITDRTPLGRFASPQEIAKPIVWLLSNDASYITGHTLRVDGGLSIDGNWYE